MDYDKFAKIWQAKKTSNKHFAHDYLEKPAINGLFEEVLISKIKTNQLINILELGCGSGEQTEYIKSFGGVNYYGLDNSIELVEFAKENYPSNNETIIDFRVFDLNNIDNIIDYYSNLGVKFDIIYSSLTMHYVENWEGVLSNLKSICKGDANIIFSCHHPIKWGSKTIKNREYNSFTMGYKKLKVNDKKLPEFEVYGDYLTPRYINEKLFNQLDIKHHHKPISLMIRDVKESGWYLNDLIEPLPIEKAKYELPDFYEVHSKIPLFMIFSISLMNK